MREDGRKEMGYGPPPPPLPQLPQVRTGDLSSSMAVLRSARNLSTSGALRGKAGSREMVMSPYKRGKGAKEAHGSGAPTPPHPIPPLPSAAPHQCSNQHNLQISFETRFMLNGVGIQQTLARLQIKTAN